MKRKIITLSLLTILGMFSSQMWAQTTVTYVMQDSNFPTQFNDGGDFWNNTASELGMWANSGNKKTVAWRTFKTGGDNSGSNRALQVGDVFKITVAATRAYGEIGFSLNAGGTQGSSYSNNTSGSRLYCSTVNYAAWNVNRSGGNSSLLYVPIQGTYKDYVFTVRITSSNTADVFLTVSGVDYRAYNLTLNGSGSIDAFSIYGADMWDGGANNNAYWKQTCSVTNSKRVELGYYLASGTYTPGIISDGLDAASTSTTSANDVLVGGDAGSMVVFNQSNSYSGATTINSNARAELQNAQALGSTSGVTIQNNGAISLYNATGIAFNSYATTLNGAGVSASNGALRSTGGNNIWPGAITLASNARVNADASGAAGSLTLSGDISVGSNTLTIGGTTSGVTVSGKISGTGALAKDGNNTLTLSNTANDYSGGTTLTAGTITIDNNSELGSGALIIGSGATTSTLSVASSTTRTQGISVTDASTAGVINVANGQTFTLTGSLTNTGSTNTTKFGKSGKGTFIVNGASTYAGQIQIGDGAVVVQNNSGLGANTSTTARGIDLGLNVGDVSQANDVQLQATNGVTVPQSIYVSPNTSGATRTIGLNGGGSATFNNEIYLDGNLSISAGSGSITLSGSLINTGGIIINDGNVLLSGNNSYTGATTINGGTLTIGAAERIANGSNILLGGGTLSTGATTGFSETVGSLTLNDNSTISLGSGSHSLTFADSNTSTWVSGKTLTITGWTGSAGNSGTSGKIFVGNSASGLTLGQLAQISFTGFSGATMLSTGELVPDLATALIEGQNSNWTAVSNSGSITIHGLKGGQKIEIYNSLGEKISTSISISGETRISGIKNSIILIKVANSTKKLFLK